MERFGRILSLDYWILHKKLVLDETITIINIFTHIF